MREPLPGDLVLHLYEDKWNGTINERRLSGYSIIRSESHEINHYPPAPGNWDGMLPYVRIELDDYTPFEKPVSFTTIRTHYAEEIILEMLDGRPRYYPFATYGSTIRTVQGSYLARCTSRLYDTFMTALGVETAANGVPAISSNLNAEYSEGRRASRETHFFTRNSALTRDAKSHYGYVCQACGFDFEATYGELGNNYIECHHLNPLAERDTHDIVTSTLSDVTVLCSNCHRMAHRRKPVMAVNELKKLIS